MDKDREQIAQINTAESTRDKILVASIWLFSQNGFNEVSVRDIAKAVGINASSIYNHFESKKAILDAIFSFYDEQWDAAQPNPDTLLAMAETEAPGQVLMSMLFDWKPELQEMMNRIYIIASREVMINPESMDRIKAMVMDRVQKLPRLLLGRLIELGRIEPIDIDAWVTILAHVSHSSTSLNLTSLRIDLDTWIRCWIMLLSVVKPTGE